MDYAREIAKAGLSIGAIKLRPEQPFQWASGYMMPIYNDNRMFLKEPEHRELVVNGFLEKVTELDLPFQFVAGVATAGIPWATLIADRVGCQLAYARDKPKGHGLRNQIEGIDAEKDLEGRTGIVIEDLVSTGGSSARAVEAVRRANGVADYLFSVFNYGLDKAVEAFATLEPPCNVDSLLTYDVLMEVAEEMKCLTQEQVEVLKEWRKDPFGWGAKRGFPRVVK